MIKVGCLVLLAALGTASLLLGCSDGATPLPGSPHGPLHGDQVAVRGLHGESLVVPNAVSFLQWQEEGQTFHAEYSSLSKIQVLEWLETWQILR